MSIHQIRKQINQILRERELKNIQFIINEDFEQPNLIFNNEQYTREDAITFLNSALSSIVPFASVLEAALSRDTIMILISFDPKEQWAHGYVENSNYVRMKIDQYGVMEVFVSSLHKKDVQISRESRLNIKFRKTRAKSLVDAVNKIEKFVNAVKELLFQ